MLKYNSARRNTRTSFVWWLLEWMTTCNHTKAADYDLRLTGRSDGTHHDLSIVFALIMVEFECKLSCVWVMEDSVYSVGA